MTGDSEFRATFLRIVGGQEHSAVDADPVTVPATPYDNLPAGIFTTDADGILTSLNATLARWLRGGADNIVGRPFANFVADAAPLTVDADDADCTETGRVTLIAEDGTSFDAVMMQHEMPSGAIEGVLLRSGLTAVDGQADDTASPPDWLFSSAPVGIVLLDLEGGVARCNPAFGRLLEIGRAHV